MVCVVCVVSEVDLVVSVVCVVSVEEAVDSVAVVVSEDSVEDVVDSVAGSAMVMVSGVTVNAISSSVLPSAIDLPYSAFSVSDASVLRNFSLHTSSLYSPAGVFCGTTILKFANASVYAHSTSLVHAVVPASDEESASLSGSAAYVQMIFIREAVKRLTNAAEASPLFALSKQ